MKKTLILLSLLIVTVSTIFCMKSNKVSDVITAFGSGMTTPGAGSGLTNIEGTDILSTGETGGTKVLTEQGDGSSAWAEPAGGGGTAQPFGTISLIPNVYNIRSAVVKPYQISSKTATAIADRIQWTTNELEFGAPIIFTTLTGGAGLSLGVTYYVSYEGVNDFAVSATDGGATVDITANYSDVAFTITGNPNGEHSVNLQTYIERAENNAEGAYSVVGGGNENFAKGVSSTVAGGGENRALGTAVAIGGGAGNTTGGSASWAVIAGGRGNYVEQDYNFIGGGYLNNITVDAGTIGGGKSNLVSGEGGTIGGGQNNTAGAGTYATVGGGQGNNAVGSSSTIGGGDGNYASSGSTVAGGYQNVTGVSQGTIGGGYQNRSDGSRSTVAGGRNNDAGNTYATIGGGYDNDASAIGSTISGGQSNTSSGSYSAVGGGINNTASGVISYAFGTQALADKYGQVSNSSGFFTTQGDAQTSLLVARNQTTNATPTELFLDNIDDQMVIPTSTTWVFEITVVGRNVNTDVESAGYKIEGMVVNDSGTPVFVPATAPLATVIGEDVAGWDAVVEIDPTNDALIIKVTGEASKTNNWVSRIVLTEVGG